MTQASMCLGSSVSFFACLCSWIPFCFLCCHSCSLCFGFLCFFCFFFTCFHLVSLLFLLFSSSSFSVKVKRGRQKGDGKKNVRKCHDKPVPSPPTPFCQRPPRCPSHQCPLKYRKEGNWLWRKRDSKDKTNGRERDALS